MLAVAEYKEAFIHHLKTTLVLKEPKTLYEPIHYILELGGKRLRPVFTLLAADIFGNDYKKGLDAALAIEVFHNFSLIHDDVMDEAPLRRGKQTVHKKWNTATAILSGDAMLILSYKLLENYPSEAFKKIIKLFNETAIKVCEGQQYDMDFESAKTVTASSYIKMITYKTAVLLGAAMKIGAILAEADENQQKGMYAFAKNLGIAFQLQDDYLDAFGNPEDFGKQIGGDILANKKTFLYIKALENAIENDAKTLQNLYNTFPKDERDKINTAKNIFIKSGSVDATKKAITDYTQAAFNELQNLNLPNEKTETLVAFGKQLMNRKV